MELAFRILEQVARQEEPTAGNIAKNLKRDLRRVKTHLDAFKTLFVLHELPPHSKGTGKPFYFLCDVALVKLLGGAFEKQLYTWLIQEQLSQRSYRDDRTVKLSYYRTSKGSLTHLIMENAALKQIAALKLLFEEKTNEKSLEILKSFREKLGTPDISLCALGGSRKNYKKEKIDVFPWESLG